MSIENGKIEQPMPIPNEKPFIGDLVMEDLKARDAIGAERYGVRLQPDNGRDTLRDAYEEALDLCFYLRSELYRRNGE